MSPARTSRTSTDMRAPEGAADSCGTHTFAGVDFPSEVASLKARASRIVTMRTKRSGQRWTTDGLGAVLTLRALHESDRLRAVWDRFARHYALPVQWN